MTCSVTGQPVVERNISYQVYDRNAVPITKFVLDGFEYANIRVRSNCSNPTSVGGPFVAVFGKFTDKLRVCDANPSCYVEFDQDWFIQGFDMAIVHQIAYDWNFIQLTKDAIIWNGMY